MHQSVFPTPQQNLDEEAEMSQMMQNNHHVFVVMDSINNDMHTHESISLKGKFPCQELVWVKLR